MSVRFLIWNPPVPYIAMFPISVLFLTKTARFWVELNLLNELLVYFIDPGVENTGLYLPEWVAYSNYSNELFRFGTLEVIASFYPIGL